MLLLSGMDTDSVGSTTPSTVESNATCEVCQDISDGLHFSVYTCRSDRSGAFRLLLDLEVFILEGEMERISKTEQNREREGRESVASGESVCSLILRELRELPSLICWDSREHRNGKLLESITSAHNT